MDRETGRSRGFGFVAFAQESSLDRAIQGLDGNEFGGRTITVNRAKERDEMRCVATCVVFFSFFSFFLPNATHAPTHRRNVFFLNRVDRRRHSPLAFSPQATRERRQQRRRRRIRWLSPSREGAPPTTPRSRLFI